MTNSNEMQYTNFIQAINMLRQNKELVLALIKSDLTHEQKNDEWMNMENWTYKVDDQGIIISISHDWINKKQMQEAEKKVSKIKNPREEVKNYFDNLMGSKPPSYNQ